MMGTPSQKLEDALQTMTIIRYLFEHTLEIVCGGNKSDYARRLGIENAELYRLLKRFKNGSSSVRATEVLLEMYLRENRSIDTLLLGYNQTPMGMTAVADHSCIEVILAIHAALEQERHETDEIQRIIREAELFMSQLERTFCNETCSEKYASAARCPCIRFAEYIAWLKTEMFDK
jgi:hypothetical protein